jgi:hypothetical protein
LVDDGGGSLLHTGLPMNEMRRNDDARKTNAGVSITTKNKPVSDFLLKTSE